MALMTRVSRLFRADLHALLDRMEEPDILLRQAVREMEEALAADERRLRLLEHEAEQLAAAGTEGEQQLARLDHELDVCFASGKTDLARTLVRRKLEARQRLALGARRRQKLADAIGSLKARIMDERAQLESMRQKAELMAAEERAPAGCRHATDSGAPVRDDEVEVAFLLEQQKRRPS